MGVDVPELDDRGYVDILTDARKRIAVHAEEWTDHNAHDPGITLLETLVWVAEAARYRLDRVTERHVLKYLWLLGVRPDPPVPASVELRVRSTDGGPLPDTLDGVEIPSGERLLADDGSDEPLVFETTTPVTLIVADLGAVQTDHSGRTANNLAANRSDGVHFLAFGPTAERGSSLALGFTSDPFAVAPRLDLSISLDETDLPPVSTHEVGEVVFEPSVELDWEYHAETDDGASWLPLDVVRDGTARFYESGRVTLARPAGWSPADWAPTGVSDQRFVAIRCRVSIPGYEIPPRIDRVAVNIVEARHDATRRETVLHQPDGTVETTALPHQTYVLPDPPVLDATIDLVAERGDTERRERWTEVGDFDASAPDDRHYVLDRARGEVRFGTNVRGAVPPVGCQVVAGISHHGGGAAGNVPRTTAWAFDADGSGTAEVETGETGAGENDDTPWRGRALLGPLGPATGGRDAESVAAAVDRLQADIEMPSRAVTADDYRYLAEHTPGVRVARAATHVLAGAGPDGADVTRVTVMPHSTLPKSVEPVPSVGLLAAVDRHLRRHRLLTDRVEVAAPKYVGVGVTVEARIVPGYSIEGRTRAIVAALDAFLDPLTGFEGQGWPFGRPVYKSELYGVVKEVSGVDWVIGISVRAAGHAGVDGEGNVLVDESALVRPLAHDVSVRFRSETTGVNPR
ncbi:putative baseplate assembly protein [Halogeometricum sp. S1BR25-6]|uniref:Baseplate assembly protein n=1 Tax=Halogeometricum salsisoli TaxID=2950536 RepID=A0ABU2GLN5_9EURY|nr:putative baseplate assembly protein [Halogeometricum sp. S1BR25-6]MDS0301119.1 putative baseplate assembly protein [Halogeometricum sp. S1BR25-6]